MSENKKDLEMFNEFDWFVPTPRKPEFALSIPNNQCLNINLNLRERIGAIITVGVNVDGKKLCMRNSDGEGYKIPKSGTLKDLNLVNIIKVRGIKLPARYIFEEIEGEWIGRLVVTTSSTGLSAKTPKKPKKKGLEMLMQMGDGR